MSPCGSRFGEIFPERPCAPVICLKLLKSPLPDLDRQILKPPRAECSVDRWQFAVEAEELSRRHGERGGLAAAHEEIKQKLTKETKGVVCLSRPKAGMASFQFSVFSRGRLP